MYTKYPNLGSEEVDSLPTDSVIRTRESIMIPHGQKLHIASVEGSSAQPVSGPHRSLRPRSRAVDYAGHPDGRHPSLLLRSPIPGLLNQLPLFPEGDR